MSMPKNVGDKDRTLRIVAATVLIILSFIVASASAKILLCHRSGAAVYQLHPLLPRLHSAEDRYNQGRLGHDARAAMPPA